LNPFLHFSPLSLISSKMDIFCLPFDMLIKIMRTLTIKDRLRLRLTCRAFEKLVADTHAGWFNDGMIFVKPGNVCANIGEQKFKNFSNDERFESFLRFRNRLYSGISFKKFTLILADETCISREDFFRQFLDKYKIVDFHLSVDSERLVTLMLQLIPVIDGNIHLEFDEFLPDSDLLLSLPPLYTLKLVKSHEYIVPQIIYPRSIHRAAAPKISYHIPAALFKTLLATHKNIFFIEISTDITPDDLTMMLQIVSADSRGRTVQFWADSITIINWLGSYGITRAIWESQDHNDGDNIGEIKVLRSMCNTGGRRLLYVVDMFRYRNCWIMIDVSEL
ncbi:hypothetical protein PENTCL1PPCAC_20713, partial [Pristionchus entomophagus]